MGEFMEGHGKENGWQAEQNPHRIQVEHGITS
jgi:hypothetical protein